MRGSLHPPSGSSKRNPGGRGSGRGGRVTASDVEAHAAGAQTLAPQQDLVPAEATEEAPLATRVSVPQEGVIERIPFRGIRRKIAEALHHSVQTAVHFTVVDEADEAKRLAYVDELRAFLRTAAVAGPQTTKKRRVELPMAVPDPDDVAS